MGKKRKAAALQEAAIAAQSRQAHHHTDVAESGLGQAAATAPGRIAKEPLQHLCVTQPAAKWSPHAVPPSTCSSCPAAAVELELTRATALDQLKHKLNSLCAKAGLRNVPLLAFERWRFAAKWAEDEPALAAAVLALQDSEPQAAAHHHLSTKKHKAASSGMGNSSSKKAKQQSDPVIPFGLLPVAPEPGLVDDLVRSGLAADAATTVALRLASAAAESASGLLKRRHQLVSGKAASCPAVAVSFHKHSLDIKCAARFVKVSRSSYGKLARLYRLHWLSQGSGSAAAVASTVGLPLDAASAKLEALVVSATTAAAAAAAVGGAKPAVAGTAVSSDDDADSSDMEDAAAEAGEHGAAAEEAGNSSRGAQHHVLLCAEARIAELEQQQQPQQQQQSQTIDSNSRDAFHQRLFVLLLRYKSIQGHGFQAAAGPPVFDLLRQRLSVGFECFASPLNAHFSRYGSAFPDVDGPFGSSGSFFRMHLKHGSCEVNPPFVPSILIATAQHLLQQLQAAEAAAGALSFVFIMPGWEELKGWQLLNSSGFLRQSVLVAAADHGYCDGASHQRKDLYRQSPFDSVVLFLQTSAAAKRWPVQEPLINELKAALAQCCPTAAAAERQKKKRGQRDLEWQGLVLGKGATLPEQQQHPPQRKGHVAKLHESLSQQPDAQRSSERLTVQTSAKKKQKSKMKKKMSESKPGL